MKKTQVGLIGTGWITPYHLKGYKALEDRVEIKAVADINRQKAKVIADELKVKFIFSDYKKLLKMEEINAVDISLPTHLHAEAVVAAAEEGKHILCEKPFATNVKECNEMLEAAKRNKVLLMPVHNRVFFPPHLKVSEILGKGLIGEPKMLKASFIGPFHPSQLIPRNWRAKRELSGGGVVIESGVHQIYMAERFMGKIIKVCAQIKEFYPSECNIEDTAVVIFEFANGSLGVFTSYWGAGFVDDGEQIIGTKGAIIVNGVENQCPRTSPLGIYTKEDKSWQFPEVEWNWSESFINLIEHFVTCLQEDKKSIITPEDGRSAIAVVEAIYRSAKEKKIVRVG